MAQRAGRRREDRARPEPQRTGQPGRTRSSQKSSAAPDRQGAEEEQGRGRDHAWGVAGRGPSAGCSVWARAIWRAAGQCRSRESAGATTAGKSARGAPFRIRQGPVPGSTRAAPRRLNRTIRKDHATHGDATGFPAPAPRSRRPFRPPYAALEPAHGALHLRRPQPGPHPRPAADRADDGPRAPRRPRRGRGRRPRALRRHQEGGGRVRGGSRDALRPVLREPPLARRHADQLEDHHRLHQAPEADGGAARRQHPGPHQEGGPDADARARQAEPRARRHQGHGRPARHHLRHRRGEGEAGDRGGQQARHPGRRGGGQQCRPAGRRLPDPRQRRRHPRHQPLLRHGRRRGVRRHLGRAAGLRRRYRRRRGCCRGDPGRPCRGAGARGGAGEPDHRPRPESLEQMVQKNRDDGNQAGKV